MKKNTQSIPVNLRRRMSALIMALCMGVLFQGGLQAADPGMKLAKDRSLPGKNKPGECAAYADALYAKMNAAGVEAYRVSFDWNNLDGSSVSGAHAVVVFRDERGRYYGVDNMTWKPIWLKGKNSQEWANFIVGMDTSASVRNTVASRAARPNENNAMARSN